jgi:hypothetical protein
MYSIPTDSLYMGLTLQLPSEVSGEGNVSVNPSFGYQQMLERKPYILNLMFSFMRNNTF